MRKAKCGITIKLPEVVAHFPLQSYQPADQLYFDVGSTFC